MTVSFSKSNDRSTNSSNFLLQIKKTDIVGVDRNTKTSLRHKLNCLLEIIL